MSDLNQFAAGGVPMGSMVVMPETTPALVNVAGQKYLKSGVVALANAYPQCPFTAMLPGPATWLARPEIFNTVAYSPTLNLFVAAGVSGSIYSSADGVTWTVRQANAAGWGQVMYWTGTRFILIPSNGSNNGWSSVNGINWSSFTFPANISNVYSVAQVGSIIIFGAMNTWFISTDSGATWAAASSVPTGGYVIASDSNFFCISGTTLGQLVYVSANGTSWAPLVNVASSSAIAGFRSDGTFVYFDNTNGYAGIPAGTVKTKDGVNWTVVGSKNSLAIPSNCAFVGGLFVWEGSAGLRVSSDGVTGRNAGSVPVSGRLAGVASYANVGAFAYGAGKLVCASYNSSPGAGNNGINFGAIASYIDNTIAASPAAGASYYMRVA